VAKFVVCSWHEQLPDVVGMRPQRTTTSVRQKMNGEEGRGEGGKDNQRKGREGEKRAYINFP